MENRAFDRPTQKGISPKLSNLCFTIKYLILSLCSEYFDSSRRYRRCPLVLSRKIRFYNIISQKNFLSIGNSKNVLVAQATTAILGRLTRYGSANMGSYTYFAYGFTRRKGAVESFEYSENRRTASAHHSAQSTR